MAMDPELAGMDPEKCLKRVDHVSARQHIADRFDEILASWRNQGRFFRDPAFQTPDKTSSKRFNLGLVVPV